MISPLWLEQPGRWRGLGLLTALLALLAPVLWLAVSPFANLGDGLATGLNHAFAEALTRSLVLALAAAALATAVGLPAGVLAALYEFPGRRVLLGLTAMPLLVPSFLWAIGTSMFRAKLGWPGDARTLAGGGCLLAFFAFCLPVVMFTTLLAVRNLSRGQMESALLAGGELCLFSTVCRVAFPIAALSGLLAGILTLSDPGPGEILGYPGVASEILVSFSAQYDFDLAGRQCLALAGAVFILGAPVAALLAQRLVSGALAREARPLPLRRVPGAAILAPGLLALVLGLTLLPPLIGFVQATGLHPPWARAWQAARRTWGHTVFYAAGSGGLATVLGFLLALCAGRNRRLRRALLVGLLIIFALPPAASALGFLHLGSRTPAALDAVFRGRGIVCLDLALRFFPVAAIIGWQRFGATSPSWTAAAALHGMSLARYVTRVLGPRLLAGAAVSALLVALLATADVGTVLLLHPPGADSFPLAIFTVMANAPEALVSLLCLLYLGSTALMLVTGAWAANRLLRGP